MGSLASDLVYWAAPLSRGKGQIGGDSQQKPKMTCTPTNQPNCADFVTIRSLDTSRETFVWGSPDAGERFHVRYGVLPTADKDSTCTTSSPSS